MRATSGDRILPALFSDNDVALMPGERRTIRTEVEARDARGEEPRIAIDGFNVATAQSQQSATMIPRMQPPGDAAEFTVKAVVTGVVLGIVFGAANAYLGLRVGLTVSASIPAAVMTVAIFRLLRSPGTILEANLSQTIGSASTALATGTIFTIPALFLWGMAPPYLQVVALALPRRPARPGGHDPAAAAADRAGPRRAAVPGGHGVRRGAARHERRARAAAPGSSAAWPWARASSSLIALAFLIPGELARRAAGAAEGRAGAGDRAGAARRRLHPRLPAVGRVRGGRPHLGARR